MSQWHSSQSVGRAKSLGPGEASDCPCTVVATLTMGKPLHRVPGDSRVKGRMGPFTKHLIYPLSPRLSSPPVLLWGNKSVAPSSATCTDQAPTPAPSLTGEGETSPVSICGSSTRSRAGWGWDSLLFYLPENLRGQAACHLSPPQGLLSCPWHTFDQHDGDRVGWEP